MVAVLVLILFLKRTKVLFLLTDIFGCDILVEQKKGGDKMKQDERWNMRYELAKTYQKEHGDLMIPRSYKVGDCRLGLWLQEQRQSYRNNTLSQARIDRLEQLGIVWNPNLTWMTYYHFCCLYYEENGNLMIPLSYQVKGIKIGNWLNTQRYLYHKNKLSTEKITLLETIGIIWNRYQRLSWNHYYELAKSYYLEHGNLLVPIDYQIGPIQLGNWIHNLRMAYRGKNSVKLTEERIEALEAIGMQWQVNKVKNLTLYPSSKNLKKTVETKKKVKKIS